MTRAEWGIGAGFYLEAHGIADFTAFEICEVGKIWGGATLYAPPPELMQYALKLAEGPLAWIRRFQGAAPIKVNSWYRSPEYNEAVGGGSDSMHLTGGAADFTKRGWAPMRVALALHHAYPHDQTLGIGCYRTFVHLDIRGELGRRSPARWAGDGVGEWWRGAAA